MNYHGTKTSGSRQRIHHRKARYANSSSIMSAPVILLTGASRGLGLAIANYLLLQPETNLVLVARTPSALDALKKQYPSRVQYVAGDLSSPDIAAKAVATAVESFGKLDAVIVNHGGLDPVGKLADIDLAEAKCAFDVNFFSALALVTASVSELRKSNGRVIFVSSGAAVKSYQAWAIYGASKAALNHLSQTLAAEESSITSIAIRPGVIDTQMQEEIRSRHSSSMGEGHQRFIDLKDSGNLLKPSQPGNVIARLALKAEKALSGKFVDWNGEVLAAYQD